MRYRRIEYTKLAPLISPPEWARGARIIPITKDGDVNLVLTGNNNFAKYTASSGGININGGAIVFNKKIAGPSVHTSISSFFSKVDECKYSFLATENNTQKEKIFVVNVCRFKSI